VDSGHGVGLVVTITLTGRVIKNSIARDGWAWVDTSPKGEARCGISRWLMESVLAMVSDAIQFIKVCE